MILKKMINNIIKLVALCTICAVFITGNPFNALASELPPEIASKVTRIDSGSISLDGAADTSVGIESKWNPGDGPAPQVTKILIYDCNVPVAEGNYRFYVNYKSDNTPYRQLCINYPFSLTAN